MKKYIPDIVIIVLLCGFISVQYTVGVSRLVYMARDYVRQATVVGEVNLGKGDVPVVSPDCRDLEPDPDRPTEAVRCLPPFQDPFAGRTHDDRPAGHLVFLVLFLIGMVGAGLFSAFRFRRELRAWVAEPHFGLPGDRPAMRHELVLVLVVLGLAVFARVFQIGTWVVEESEWGAVERLPLLDVIFHGRETAHEPPLFTALQHFVYMVNDHSLAWTRSLTCLTGILLVMAVWRSSRMIFGPRTALLATALVAAHPFMVSNSHVVRPYSLASFFVVMALPHAFRMADDKRLRNVVAFAIFGGLAIWTHYTSLIALLVMYLYMLYRLARHPDRSMFMRMVSAAFILLVFFLPFIPYFLTDFSSKQGSWISPEFVDDTLAAITGIPFGAGWLVVAFPVLTGLRRSRSGGFLMFFSVGMLAVMAATMWMVWWEPTHMAVLAPVLAMTVAAAAVRLRPRQAHWIVAPWFVAMSVMTGILFSLPSSSPVVWEAARPMTWHGMSYRLHAEKLLELMESDPERYRCEDVFMTPVDLVSGFIYYWGPVTPEEIGMKPIEPNNFQTFELNVDTGGRSAVMRLKPIERLWSWRKGQWIDLHAALMEKGCLWYLKAYQNCSLKTGRFYSHNDCRWLNRHCDAVVSMPDSELWFCRSDSSGDR